MAKAFFKPNHAKLRWFFYLVVLWFIVSSLTAFTGTPLWWVFNIALAILSLPVVILFYLAFLVGGPLFAAFGGDFDYFIDWILPIWAIGLGLAVAVLLVLGYLYFLACLIVAIKQKHHAIHQKV